MDGGERLLERQELSYGNTDARARGEEIVVSPANAEVSPTEAGGSADNVASSGPKLMDCGLLEFRKVGTHPLFLTVTRTRGQHSHTDVSFWFVLDGDEDMHIDADPREAHAVRWFALDDPAEWAHDRVRAIHGTLP